MELKYPCLVLFQLNAEVSKLKEEVSKRDQQLLEGEARWVSTSCVADWLWVVSKEASYSAIHCEVGWVVGRGGECSGCGGEHVDIGFLYPG